MSDTVPAEYVDFAHALADASGPPIRRHFRTRVSVEDKPDASPVTAADREAESAMRAMIAQRYPSHGVGEEFGGESGDAADVWVLDPIDGTRAFIAGKPIFGTLIALLRDGRPVLGVIDQPVLGERWIGVAGTTSRFCGARIGTRSCAGIDRAILNTTSPDLFDGADRAAFGRLSARARSTLYGGDCYAYGLLASGHIDLVVEAGLRTYDFCALVPVVEGAGGCITDWDGNALDSGSDGRSPRRATGGFTTRRSNCWPAGPTGIA